MTPRIRADIKEVKCLFTVNYFLLLSYVRLKGASQIKVEIN